MCGLADWMIGVFLSVSGVIDFKKKEIPLWLLLLMGICILFFRVFWIKVSLRETLTGVLIGGFFFCVGKLTEEAVGYGDCWAILLLGIYKGGFVVLQMILAASMAAAIVSLVYCLRSGWKRKQAIPFLPFLALSYLGVVLF